MTHTADSVIPPFESQWALFLDVDGTLVDFVEHPEHLSAGQTLIEVLEELHRLNDGAVALVSGRAIASVDAIVEPLRLPASGLHGHERRDARGRFHRPPLGVTEERALADARSRFNELVVSHPGTFIEEKGPALALHYRRAPKAADDVETLASELERRLPVPLCVQRGKMVMEIRSCDHSKGSAIEAFMDEAPFAGRTPVFVGDDVTDEHGFQWVNEHGGVSIKVGAGESVARFRLPDVESVRRWLEDYVRFLRERDEAEHVS